MIVRSLCGTVSKHLPPAVPGVLTGAMSHIHTRHPASWEIMDGFLPHPRAACWLCSHLWLRVIYVYTSTWTLLIIQWHLNNDDIRCTVDNWTCLVFVQWHLEKFLAITFLQARLWQGLKAWDEYQTAMFFCLNVLGRMHSCITMEIWENHKEERGGGSQCGWCPLCYVIDCWYHFSKMKI